MGFVPRQAGARKLPDDVVGVRRISVGRQVARLDPFARNEILGMDGHERFLDHCLSGYYHTVIATEAKQSPAILRRLLCRRSGSSQ